jgi:hypothetical protein
MTLSEHLQKEELERLNSAWRRLSWFQRKALLIRCALSALPRLTLKALDQHIHHRRTRFAYLYHAHWV